MGWSFRRSAKLGPFRLNFSKRGMGVSVGVPGARTTLRADGRLTQTFGLPGTGIRYQHTISGGGANRTIARSLPYHPGRPPTTPAVPLKFAAIAMVALAAGCWMIVGAATGGANLPLFVLVGFGLAVLIHVWSKSRARRQTEALFSIYLQNLMDRFGEETAALMVQGEPWQGATQEMVQIMFGPPADVSTRVRKQTTSHTWKYQPIARNRYAMKIDFENGICVGWKTA